MVKLLTASEVSRILALPLSRIYFLVRENQLPFAVKIGARQVRFSEAGLSSWILNGGNIGLEREGDNDEQS